MRKDFVKVIVRENYKSQTEEERKVNLKENIVRLFLREYKKLV
ncbi:hypothetical protein AGMMS49975_06710 [Clostridia bacterium]|nr:hypothetical protein AGMMS49975_06710 [Clostridia bacterium]GHU73913.1 hypothetical protein FACS1894188_00670 [Clostridia bacterium]